MQNQMNNTIFACIDKMRQNVDGHRNEPLFKDEVAKRQNNRVAPFENDNQIYSGLAEVISYSNAAQSSLVEEVISSGALAAAFSNFDVDAVARLNPCDIVDDHWPHISAIRKKTKIFQLVLAARAIKKMGGLVKIINDANIPRELKSNADIDQFWSGFETLRQTLVSGDIPYIKAHTSLLHFLLHMGFDCAKPDSAVMKASGRLGIVPSGQKVYGEGDYLKTVRIIQEYGVSRNVRPSVVDFYLLIEGGQTSARRRVLSSFTQTRFE